MKIYAETERLILRELLPDDVNGILELDSDPEVHRYLGNTTINTTEESSNIITHIRNQYTKNGIGRWAVIEKETGLFMGWSGLKLITTPTNNHINYYDLGYRLIKKYWGKGYATESALASIDYAFKQLNVNEIYAIADVNNQASIRILEKVGLKRIEIFDYGGVPHYWLKLEKQ
ncbi:GNAT family N-acetyltransferase [Pedobacter punctiformis]|uniref:GNAT family N-acetyltransferase n=1 Tax=Pedobacter punctiformis TaxID=3004097 RepID=A0ABT4L9M3_9SPHI|nr:GNAT family N-acetyltransferase [Pedobacter sp. HCMS5-2]MCZ4244632.1 GNAT family N-acetyltransferase [Pedobacter sp. HCMS5-2]